METCAYDRDNTVSAAGREPFKHVCSVKSSPEHHFANSISFTYEQGTTCAGYLTTWPGGDLHHALYSALYVSCHSLTTVDLSWVIASSNSMLWCALHTLASPEFRRRASTTEAHTVSAGAHD